MPDFDFKEYIKRIESHPEFKTLPYGEQVKTRLAAFDEDLKYDPKYQFMSPEDFTTFRQAIGFRLPVAETPEIQSHIEATYKKFTEMSEAPEVFEEENPFWGRAATAAGTVVAFGMGGPIAAAVALGYGTAKPTTKPIILESAKSQFYGITKATGFFGLPNAVAKFAPKVFYKVSQELDKVMGRESPLTGVLKANADAVGVNQQHFRDWDKWEEFTDLLFNEQDRGKLLSHANLKKATTFGAQMAELYLIPNKALSTPFEALSRTATPPVVREGLALLRGASNLAIESGMELARQYAIDFGNQRATDPVLDASWAKTSSLFTDKVVGNVIGKTLFNGARIAFGAAKHIIKGGGLIGDKPFKDLADLEARIKNLVYSKGVAPEVIANAGKGVQEGVDITNSLVRVGRNVEPLSEETALKVMAFDSGYSLHPGKSPGSYVLTDLNGSEAPKGFSTWTGVQDYFSKSMSKAALRAGQDLKVSAAAAESLDLKMTPEYLQHLATKRGVPIEPLGKDGWKVGGTDFPTSLDAARALIKDKVMPDGKMSPDLAPDLLLTGPGMVATNYVAPGVVQGPTREILKHLEGFSTGRVYKKLLTTVDGSRIEKDEAMGLFRVYDSATNFTKEFTSSADAIKWLNAGDGELFKLRATAAGKGYALDYKAGHYVIHSNDHVLTFTSLMDLRKGLKALPNPEFIPEATGLGGWGAELGAAGGLTPETSRFATTPNKRPITQFIKFDSVVRPVDTMLAVVSEHAGLPTSLGERGRELAVAQELTRKATADWEKAWYDAITPSWGKGRHILNKPENIEIYNLIREAPTREGVTKLLAEYSQTSKKAINISDWLEVYDRTRAFYGQTPSEGIGGFNLIGTRAKEGPWELGYATRKFKDFADKMGKDWWGDDSDVVDIARKAGIREEHLAFFRHARKADIANMARLEDPMTSTLAMIRMSARQKYFNPAMDAFEKEVDIIGESGSFSQSVVDYLKNVEGLFNGKAFARMDRKEASKWVRDHVIARIPGIDKAQTKTLLDALLTMGYSNALGMRVFPIIRNAIEQPFTTLAARVGTDNVVETYKEFASNPKALLKAAQEHGVLSNGGEIAKAGGTKAGIGLGAYMRADDVTRVVGYMSARKPISLAIEQLERGVIKKGDLDTFLKSSMLRTFEKADQLAILKKIDAGDSAGAIDLYARIVTADTMVPMWRALQPGAIRKTNVVAKVFGNFGTYSFSWLENIRRGLGRGTGGDRIAYAARFVAGSAMLMGTMKALGIKPDTFNPMQPLGFSGGPWFDIGVNAIKANPFNDRYDARQARAKLAGLKYDGKTLKWDLESAAKSQLGTWLVPMPGWMYARSLSKLPDYLNKKQYYRAFIHALGAPTNPEYFGDTK